MKHLLRLLAIITITGLNINAAHATHAAGMDLSYQCVGNNQYLFYATFYRDCNGIEAPFSLPIDIFSISCNYNATFTANLVFSTQGSDTISHLAGLCPGFNSQCVGGTYTGYEQYIYSVVVTLPFECNDWVAATHESARNDAITNLETPGNYDLYVECHMDNTGGLCDNSPLFSIIPLAYCCVNQLFVYNHGAYDPDGDSLVYTLVNPLDTLNGPIPYSSTTLNPTYPLYTTTGDFGFDNLTGEMTCTPNSNQIAVISVRIDEYRNGVKIGSTQRDLQVVVRPCNNNVPEIPLGIENVSGAQQIDPNTIVVCPGATVEFDLVGVDVDAGDNLTLNTNLSATIPTATFDTSGINPITGHFTWNTSPADSGFYVFTVTIADNGCPIKGQQVYSYTIEVSKPPVDAGPDSAICITNPVIQLNVTGQAPFLWNNSSYINDPTSATPVATLPDTGTYMFVVTGDVGGFCERNDTVYISVDPNVIPTGSVVPDTVCAGDPVDLSVTSSGGSGGLTYTWTSIPPGFTSNDPFTTANPTVPTKYVISISSGACINYDTVSVYARPLPASDFTVNPLTLCEGQVAGISYNGASVSTNQYDWGFSNGHVVNGTGSGPYNVSWDTAGTKTVTLTVTDPHGCHSTNTIDVTVNPNPDVSFESITGGCEPLTIDFTNTSTGGASYMWTFGDGTTSTEESPSHTYNTGVYDVSLTVTSPAGCVTSINLPNYIEVLPVPIADASVVEDITHPWDVSQATFHFQNNSQNATSYSWDFGDGTTSTDVNPTHSYTTVDTFYVVLTASNIYCSDTIRLGPIIVVFYNEIYFPTAFSPNSDGTNDAFHELQQVGLTSLFYAVYDRWGELIYETNQTDGRWDGTYKGEPAEVGVYVWYAKAVMVNGTHVDRKGNVTLVR